MPLQVALASRHALSLVDTDYNCTRISSEVHICTVSSPRAKKEALFHKLICMIEIFMRKIFMVQHYPRNILTLNYFQTTVYLIIIAD